ncbi:MAG: polyhydroxyalkanoic acid system family protein [Chloroflexota bacterium]
MKVSFPHGTTKDRALEELKANNSKLMARFGTEISGLQQEWQENGLTFSFRAQGVAISGKLAVGEEHVELEAELPRWARLFEGQVRERALQVMQEIFTSEMHDKEQSA